MPLSVNGFGTAYYGEADRREDGSFVTTEWICAAWVPIVPLRSLRLVRSKSEDANLVIFHEEGFHVVERLSLHWAQVLRVYGFLVVAGLWWWVAIWVCFTKFDIQNDPRAPWIVSTWVLAMALPIALVVLFRRIAYSRRKKRSNRVAGGVDSPGPHTTAHTGP